MTVPEMDPKEFEAYLNAHQFPQTQSQPEEDAAAPPSLNAQKQAPPPPPIPKRPEIKDRPTSQRPDSEKRTDPPPPLGQQAKAQTSPPLRESPATPPLPDPPQNRTQPVSVVPDAPPSQPMGVCLVPRSPANPLYERRPTSHIMYIEDYVHSLLRMGVPHFQLANDKPFLVGIGIIGELDNVARSTRDTRTREVFIEDIQADADHSPSLGGRVWPLIDTKNALTPIGISVGRSAINDVVISEYALSKVHCRFNIGDKKNHYVVQDLESTNGTMLNGVRLEANEPAPIEHFDVLVLGRFQFQYCSARGFIKELIDRAKTNTV